MRVIQLRQNPNTYTCRPYLVLGNWSRLEDINTIIDPGPDDYILEELGNTYTGVGKRAVEQIILTHNHFDHAGGIEKLKKQLNPTILAFAPWEFVNRTVRDGERVKVGDRDCLIIHTPAHSSDSICLFFPEEGILFSGDVTFRIHAPDDNPSPEYLMSLKRLAKLPITQIFYGHDSSVETDGEQLIRTALKNLTAHYPPNADGHTVNWAEHSQEPA